ncbi:hypothetical protein M529_10680 [Sphingobium ummariense RL-3]|uniref:Uncharacterized protein n=1 Tax=Sphingobium ummariense RL-3 TaxID=1346791 RepID=T0K6F8_9SPHN|nr:hypothetical protein M529_10680 [Sphingobium ummariense RL-3]
MACKRNAPARKGEGAVCLLADDIGAYSTAAARIQYLAARHGLSVHRAALLAPMAFGVAGHG